MVSDSISTVPFASAASTKNLGKKKKTNRSAKLKQCKIDARREQWLSQGVVVTKSKVFNDGVDDDLHMHLAFSDGKGNKGVLEKLDTRTGGKEEEDEEGLVHQDSDSESLWNSPTSVNSCNESGTNFTGSCSSGSSSSTGSGCCCSGNITEEEVEEEEGRGDDGCLDDWEAVADALAANEKCQNPCSESTPVQEPVLQMMSPSEVIDESATGAAQNFKPHSARLVSYSSGNARAWRPDDTSRPQSLPNISKQQSLPNHDRGFGGGVPWACTSALASSCPICCEDLDLTDSSFLPCRCGFRLCLFCHKRILEEDGRCPGCRKPYECQLIETEASAHTGSLTLRLARPCSMIERS